jgi:hypothetical protein
VFAGTLPTVRQPARLNATLSVVRSRVTTFRYRCMLSIQSPVRMVAWANALPPPYTGEVRNALRESKPAARSLVVPSSRRGSITGALSEFSIATRP